MTAPATKAIPRSAEHITYVRYCESSRTPIHLCYQCFGDPTVQKEALVLIGGLNMQMTAFDETFCELLVESGFFVIRVDNRDCGFSTKVDGSSNNIILPGVSEKKSGEEEEEYGGTINNNMNKEFKVVGPGLLFPRNVASFFFGERLPYTIESMAKDILYLMIQQLKINTFHVLGISMGGMIAQTLLLLAPRHVRSLTSLMSTTNAPDLPDAQMWVKLWMLRKPPKYVPNPAIPNDKGVSDTIYHQNEALNHLLNFRVQSQQKLLTQTIPVDQNYLKNRYLLSLRRSPYGDGLLRQAAAIRRCPSRDGLFQKYNHTVISHVPVLVIHGAQDLVVPPAHGYRTAEMIAHSRLLIFKSMGHYFHPIFFYPIAMAMKEMATVVLTTQHALLQENESHSNFSWLNPSAPPSIAKLIADSNHHRLTKEEEEDNKGTFPSSAVSETPPSQYSSLYEAGRLYLPVVVSPGSPTGKAACAAVNVAVPLTIHKSEQHKSPDKKAKLESTPSSPTTSATTGNPSTMLPEAVLVDLNDSTAISVLHKWGVDPVARNMNPPPTNNNNSQNNSEEDLIYPLLPGMPSVWDTISLQNRNIRTPIRMLH
ncbi:hydrolase-like protein [Angomonas deanei]|nr:hydrolase-like protein [Angomonas deanei]|eukprot:EPY42167.1 hydrolase-like protein [Angomonas deanei]